MKNFDLTAEEIQELRAAHKSAKNKSDAYKINTIILLGTDWTLEEVVDALLLDDETLRAYVKNQWRYLKQLALKLFHTFSKASFSQDLFVCVKGEMVFASV